MALSDRSTGQPDPAPARDPKKKTRPTINDALIAEIAKHPDGATGFEIAAAVGVSVLTCQMRLSKLYQLGLVDRLKKKRIVYKIVAKHHMVYVPKLSP